MTDERDQSTRNGVKDDSLDNSVYAALVRQNLLVDEDVLLNAVKAATVDDRGILDVLVERGEISRRMRQAILLMAEDMEAPVDLSSEATVPPTNPVASLDEATPPPTQDGNVDLEARPPKASDETATIAPGMTPSATVTGKSLESPSSFGDYEILSEIARGGMGIVYKARQISLNRVVALKKVLSGQLAGEEDIQRFRIEAEASANLDHPGIVPVYDFGEVDGQHYFSMGFVEGRSLADRINESPLEPREAAELAIKIAQAVAYANEKGVIHRDLKPGNVLLDQAGEPRVTDFGLAKQQADDSGMTATGQILGTPSYMPPEQASGKADEVDQRADVYALGAILYACLTGRPPFQAANPIETLRQLQEQEPVSLRQLIANMPRDLETICLKALRKETDRRYDNACELADDMQRWLDGEPIRARRVSRTERVWKWCKRKPVVVGSVASVVILVVAGSLIFWERQNASRVTEQINSLVNADATQVPPLIDELMRYAWWSEPRLRKRLSTAREGSIEELHLSLALLRSDRNQDETLLKQLPTANPAQVDLIRAGLAKDASREAISQLWQQSTDPSASDTSRLNAACVLASVDSDSKRWAEIKNDAAKLLVEALSRSPRDYDALVSLLKPQRTALSEPLGRLCRDPSLSALQQETAFNVLVEYAADQPAILCDVAMDADIDAFERILELLEPMVTESIAVFTTEIARSLDEAEDQSGKDRIGQRQANAAIALFRLSQPVEALPLLSRRLDPRGGSWFIDRVDEYGVSPELLLESLDVKAEGDEVLMVQMSLLQALGQFSAEQLSESSRETIIPSLLDAYRDHPDPGLHGSIAWLLRQWGRSDALSEAEMEMQLDIDSGDQNRDAAFSDDVKGAANSRNWFVNGQGQTMVFIDAGEFMMGTIPESDPDIFPDEIYHLRRINRTIAIGSTEITKAQFRVFEQDVRPLTIYADHPRFAEVARTEDSPMMAVTWYEAAWYCNWLSEQEGLSEDQWCYAPNDAGKYGPGMRIKRNYWDLSGYRLPTEAEWEFACRAGSVSRRHYGYSEDLLPRYARYMDNAETHSWPVGFQPPNAFGLFDTLGNAYEWCQDVTDMDYSQAERINEDGTLIVILDEQNWEPVSDATFRVFRGGSFANYARNVRSANRNGLQPNTRVPNGGFRVVRTYPSSP